MEIGAESSDLFELRVRLSKLATNLTNSQGIRNARSFMLKNAVLAQELLECLVELFVQEAKLRRGIVALLEALYESPANAYRAPIVGRLGALIETLTKSDAEDNPMTRSVAKALKNLLNKVEPTAKTPLGHYVELLQKIAGISENEQARLMKRQSVLDQIERDREAHKVLREACWARGAQESATDEFLSIWRRKEGMNRRDFSQLEMNLIKFCQLNNVEYVPPRTEEEHGPLRKRPRDKDETTVHDSRRQARDQRRKQVIIIETEQVLTKLSEYLETEGTVRRAADRLDQTILEVAKKNFFYRDLRDFAQPHIYYYQDDDDGRDLSDYNFGRDILGRELDRNDKAPLKGCYRERSFRYRVAAKRYDHPKELIMDRDLHRAWADAHEQLNRHTTHYPNDTRNLLADLFRDADTTNVIMAGITHSHLSLAMATNVVFKLDRVIPARAIYSTTKFGTDWVLQQLLKKYGPDADYVVLGNSREMDRAAERLRWKYYRIRNLADFENAILRLKSV